MLRLIIGVIIMSKRIHIGNQTAFSSGDIYAPLEFAILNHFDAFEWYSDKKHNPDGSTSGWDFSDIPPSERDRILELGRRHDILYTVHVPWVANPSLPGGCELIFESIDFSYDIGAGLINLHLCMDLGAFHFLDSLIPVINYASRKKIKIAIENTPATSPSDFNEFFNCLYMSDYSDADIGMCIDIGHANLCQDTHNDFVKFIDKLSIRIPIIHAHVHENYGDMDRHMPLFTGPANVDDSGICAFVDRLKSRHFSGAMIMEVWPNPPELLISAENRLRRIISL